MSKELIHHLINKRYESAETVLKEEMMNIVQVKLEEKKKMIAAGLTNEGLFRKAQTDPSTNKPITRTKALRAAMELNKGNFAVPAAIAAGGIAAGAGIAGTSPKALATASALGAGIAGAAHVSHIAKDYRMFRGKGKRAYRPDFANDVLRDKIFEQRIMKAISKIAQRRRNPKGLAEGSKTPKEAVEAALAKYFDRDFTTGKQALSASKKARSKDPKYQKWLKRREKSKP